MDLLLIIIMFAMALFIIYKQGVSSAKKILLLAFLIFVTGTCGGLAYGAFASEPINLGLTAETFRSHAVLLYGIVGFVVGVTAAFIWSVASSAVLTVLRRRQ